MNRVDSGIQNLDRLLGGGIPRRHMALVEGVPGAGKSNLGLEFLYRGAQKGENGVYVSFQDTAEEVMRATTFDWEFEKHMEQGSIRIFEMDPYRHDEAASAIRGELQEIDAKRAVIDPITAMDLYIDSRKDIRKNLLDMETMLKDLGVTTLLVAEATEATEVEEEVADTIISMEMEREEDQMQRKISVRKVRGSGFEESLHPYEFTSKGLKVL
jgi:circadian clock protein KaiC